MNNPIPYDPKVHGAVLHCDCDAVEFQAAEKKDGSEGPPSFHMIAYTGGKMSVDALPLPVVVDLAGLNIGKRATPIRADHDRLKGVGHTTAVSTDGRTLVADGIISRDTEVAREIVASSKKGFPWQASVGVRMNEVDFIESDTTMDVNGRRVKGPMYIVRSGDLTEISFVDRGADSRTSVAIAAKEVEDMKKSKTEAGDQPVQGGPEMEAPASPPAESTIEANALEGSVAVKPKASEPAVQPVAPDPAMIQAQAAAVANEVRASALAESKRVAGIRRLCAANADLEAKAIEEGWNLEKTELEMLRASRPVGPTALHFHRDTVSSDILEAAVMQAARYENLEEDYTPEVLEAAHKKFRGTIGLHDLMMEAAVANGDVGRSFKSDSRGMLSAAFGQLQAAAGFSTINISNILSNIANKFLLTGFFGVEQVWRRISATRPVSDFKTVTSYRLTGNDQYQEVGPGGELKHGTLGEESYTNQAKTYGLMLSVTRTDIINDDLNAISTVPRKLGRGAGLKLNDVFWTAFLDNASFFTSGNGTYFEGAGTDLNINSLTTAEIKFMNLVDSDGKPLALMPTMVLVPPALSAVSAQLFRSAELRDTTSSTKYPVANPHQGKFEPVVGRYLSNASYSGYSTTAWYLLGNPSDLPVIEVAFLNGNESPTIESADADFNVLGVQMRGFHDFGVTKQDYRGGVKSKGAA